MSMLTGLQAILGRDQIKTNEPLSRHATLGVGGPAQFFYEASQETDLIKAVRAAKKLKLPFFILGSGSNIVISDKGVKGLVISNKVLGLAQRQFSRSFSPKKIRPRLKQIQAEKYLDTGNLEASFNQANEKLLVSVGSGWKINVLIMECFKLGLVGLEWFAGIPGSVGGAVYMNIHGGNHFFSEFILSVRVYDPETDKTMTLDHQELKFAYDFSVFHEKPWVILGVNLVLYRGNKKQAEKIQQYWLRNKLLVQPQRSCGSVWQNLTEDQRRKQDLPTSSIGYLIEKHLGLKGTRIGGAQISPKHAGFIENLDQAKASDVLELIRLVEAKARKLGIKLKREIIVVGE